MKVCQYCDTLNSDDAAVCKGCGARAFYNMCGNCRKVFEGLYCPGCGVKAGAEAALCPECGRTYYTNACPDCGYTPERARREAFEQERRRVLERQNAERAQIGERRQEREERLPERRLERPERRSGPEPSARQQTPKKERNTLLWVLGWIFIFPLPLTILTMRKKSGCFGFLFKIFLLIIVWLFYLSILVSLGVLPSS